MLINANLTTLDSSSTIVVANNRQALAFKQTYSKQCPNTQLPKIFAWRQYLQHTWKATNFNSKLRLIDSIESRYLMSEVISQSGQRVHQLLLDEVLKNLDYCHNHLIDTKFLSQSKLPISESFAYWISTYQQLKDDRGLIDTNDLPKLLIGSEKTLNSTIIYGFKTLTPQQQALFDSLNYQQISAIRSDQSECVYFENTKDEIYAAANWAKQQPRDLSVVIVCPQLNELQHQISSIFNQTFNNLLTETGDKSYNISLGLPLLKYPLVQDLMAVLKLNKQIQSNQIELDTFIHVVRCVYIAHYQQEQSARHLLINHALSLSKEVFTLQEIHNSLQQCPKLFAIIDTIKQESGGYKNLDNCLSRFQSILTQWGFATNKQLNSTEYQLFHKFLTTSLSLNRLSLHGKKIDIDSAINLLQDICNHVIFQPQSSNANIQILGSLEAEGLYFDKAWVMGMNDGFIPAKLNSPRFIPHDIAVNHQIPHSSFELITTDANNTLNNLSSLANNVIFSYAQTLDEQEQLPSPLLEFRKNTIKAPNFNNKAQSTISLNDSITTQFNQQKVSSGVSLLKDQMACAFKGFVHRLNTTTFDKPHIGFDKKEQGNIVHNALQYIYEQLNSKEQLCSLSNHELARLVEQKVYAALKRYPNSNFKKIEQQRIVHLILKFIELDKTRENFSVLETEKSITAELSGLMFTTRLDRLDQMDNGDKIVFDYKTGTTSISNWCSQAIREPQLPIYSITNHTQGAAFIELDASKISIKGISKDKDSLPKQSTRKTTCGEWDEQLGIWSETLNQAAQNFQSGQAQVLPNKTACEYCELDLLCRVEK